MSKKIKPRAKRIVCLGGGNAMPKAVLTGLKKQPFELTVICAMLDSGGSAGRLRKDYGITSPGDIRRALLALANTSPVLQELFNYRFQTGHLKGHHFANLFITALELATNNYEKTFQELNRILNITHQVLPVTLDNSQLYAVLENRQIIKGESNIDIPKHNGHLRIKKVYLKPVAHAYPKAVAALKKAHFIIIGPGDLYSSLMQILLTKGIPETIKASRAKKIFICNLMTKYGETNNFSVLDFTKEIEKYLKSELDYIIYNNFVPDKKILLCYKRKHPELLELVRVDEHLPQNKFIGANLLKKDVIEHNPEKLARLLLSIINKKIKTHHYVS